MAHMVTGLQMKTFKTGKQVVDWKALKCFNVDGHDVKVVSNETIVKVSKSGKERKERRLTVTIDGIHSIEVGTESVKKGSFINRLLKETMVIYEPTEEPVDEDKWWEDEDRFSKLDEDQEPKYSCWMECYKGDDRYDQEKLQEAIDTWNDESEFDINELERMVGFEGAKEYP